MEQPVQRHSSINTLERFQDMESASLVIAYALQHVKRDKLAAEFLGNHWDGIVESYKLIH